jgi:oligoribonuclease (3'-5' exoribonuclease)
MSKPKFKPTKYLWVDLEMTGLVPEKDVILEVAAEVSDVGLETLDSYEATIQSDRAFIKQWMPELELRLHYRMLDVTSWKVVMETMYGVEYEKPEVHRAFEDIQASIAELQFYLQWFKEQGHEL